jgi:hypothetical protein
MAYSLHITRQKINFDRKPEFEISDSEWDSFIQQHPEFKLVDSIIENGLELKLKNTKIAKWTAPNGKNIWFKLYKGNISVVGPDETTVKKMKEIASSFHAKVQGDDGEFY